MNPIVMKCGKVKNPCKICLQSVSNKNGLQCKGACKKWAHYKCLNFTPGKISDVKAGLIKITCPCPNCSTSEPKEVLTNPPYTCTNQGCPASKIPSCESAECPSKQKPIPPFQPLVPTAPKPESPKLCATPPPCPEPQPKKTPPRSCPTPPRIPSPPRLTTPPRCPESPTRRPISSPKRPVPLPRPISPKLANAPRSACPSCPTHCPRKRSANRMSQQKRSGDRLCPPQKKSGDRLCPPKKKSGDRLCPPQKKSGDRLCPPQNRSGDRLCPPQKRSGDRLCPPQNRAGDRICSPQRSQSCSLNSDNSQAELPRNCSSDSTLPKVQDRKAIFNDIEAMCNTVGQLSNQLNDLMCRMIATFEKPSRNRK